MMYHLVVAWRVGCLLAFDGKCEATGSDMQAKAARELRCRREVSAEQRGMAGGPASARVHVVAVLPPQVAQVCVAGKEALQ